MKIRRVYHSQFSRVQNKCLSIACGCLLVVVLLYGRLASKQLDRSSSYLSPVRFSILKLWAVKDDDYFTDEEYEELLTSSLRRQHFVPMEISESARRRENAWGSIIEGKADYFADPDSTTENEMIGKRTSCKIPVKNILFLKTHFTGSDVITNIVNRYADIRELLVALPSDGLTSFYWPSAFHWRYMDIRRLQGNLPNVLSNHARYNADVMEKFMPYNTHYVTILRNPIDYFVTLYEELDISKRMVEGWMPNDFEDFVANIKKYLQNAIKQKRFSNTMNLLKNGMFFDLGLRTSDYNNEIAINTAIFDLQNKFSAILIYEYLDESLVLMKRKLCWDIDDVVYLSAALPRTTSSSVVVSSRARRKLATWNVADKMLYDTFNASLWENIRQEKDFETELMAFKARRSEIEKYCNGYIEVIPDTFSPLNTNTNGTLGTTINLKQLCEKMAMSTRDYLDYFRDKTPLVHGTE